MTTAEIEAVSIGEAFAWYHDRVVMRSDETAIAYRINGLPPHLIADLGPSDGIGRWAFQVFDGPKPLHPKNSHDSKNKAFAALKDWLRATQV
jgi:hypothetical protein